MMTADKKMKKLTALTVVLMCALCSCDKWLDVDPVSNIVTSEFYKTPKEVEYALTGIYSGLLPISEYYWNMGELRADHLWTSSAEESNTKRDYIDIMTFSSNQLYADMINKAWLAYFKIITRANLLIEMMEYTEFDESAKVDLRRSYEGEARVLRAFAYFDLVRFFGRVPMVTSSQTVDEAMQTGQSDSREIYEKVIIPDLQFAADSLYETAYNYDCEEVGSGRVNSIVAKALLGRVYATMAGFPLYDTAKAEDAKLLLKEVVDYAFDNDLYWAHDGKEWQEMWLSDNDNEYHIWEIQYAAKEDYGNPMVYWMIPNVSSKYIDLKMSGYNIYGREEFLALFDTDMDGDGEYDDVRRMGTINYEGDNSTRFITKFFEHKIKRKRLGYADNTSLVVNRSYFPINFPLIRLEDVMLLYAELDGGVSEEAVGYVNKIRDRAGIGPMSDEERADFQTAVDIERQRELAGEGIRWHDIVRRGTWQKLMKDKFHELGTASSRVYDYALRVLDGTYLYPIPDVQMKVKDGLYEQNESY